MLDQLMLSGKMQHTAEPSLLHCINSTWKQQHRTLYSHKAMSDLFNLETTEQNTVQPQSHVRSVQPGQNRTPYSYKVMSDLFNLETTEQNTVQLQSHVRSVQPGNNRTEHRTATKSCQICSTWKLWHRTAYSYPVLCNQLHMQITVQNNLQLCAGCISLLFGERTTEQTPDLTWRWVRHETTALTDRDFASQRVWRLTDLVGLDLVVDLLDAHFTGAHVTALGAQALHAGQGQFTQVAVLHARWHQRHGDIPEHPHKEQHDNDSWGHQWHGSRTTSIHNDTSGIQYDIDL